VSVPDAPRDSRAELRANVPTVQAVLRGRIVGVGADRVDRDAAHEVKTEPPDLALGNEETTITATGRRSRQCEPSDIGLLGHPGGVRVTSDARR